MIMSSSVRFILSGNVISHRAPMDAIIRGNYYLHTHTEKHTIKKVLASNGNFTSINVTFVVWDYDDF